MTDQVQMIRNSIPLMETVMGALKPFPEASKAVADAVAAAATPRNEKAEVNVNEVDNWVAHGWQRADQGGQIMSTPKDPSQGAVPDPKQPAATPVAKPDNQRQFREIQRDVNAADRESTKQKHRPAESNPQDWRRG